MRVLHVTQPVVGGVCTVVNDLARYQAFGEHDIHLASPAGQLPELLGGIVEWHEWPAVRQPGASVIREARQLTKILQLVQPDLIHLHSAKAGLCGRLVARGRIATIYQPHGWSFLAVEGASALMARTWERQGARWADVVVCVSKAERRIGETTGVHPGQYEQCSNAVRLDQFGTLPKPDARSALRLDEDAPLVLCVARLSREKGVDLLLDAWPRVLQVEPDATLLVVGDGPERNDIERRARELNGRVSIVGARQDVPTWYSAADVVVLPSRYEAMAMAPLEAMASGRPVVGFDVPGFAESVGSSVERDVVIPLQDFDALARAITRRLGDPCLRRHEGERNLLHATEHHGAQVAGRRMETIYRETLMGSRRVG